MYKNLIVEKKEDIALITFDRKEFQNALCNHMVEEIDEAIIEIESDKSIKVLIFTGAGNKSFMAGADINELRERDSEIGLIQSKRRQFVFNRISNLAIPTISAINGYALGAGLELALATAIRIGSTISFYASPEVKLGITPADGGTQRLPRVIGEGRAMEMILTGNMINAEKAYSYGLITEVVESDELMNKAFELAKCLIGNSQLAIQFCKVLVQRALDMNLESGLEMESSLHALACGTEDKNSRVERFINKKKR